MLTPRRGGERCGCYSAVIVVIKTTRVDRGRNKRISWTNTPRWDVQMDILEDG